VRVNGRRTGHLLAFALLALLAVPLAAGLPRLAQDPSYHDFADQRAFLGVPRFADTVSNLPLFAAGVAGLALLWPRFAGRAAVALADPRERWPLVALYAGLTLTAAGSACYHLAPDNARLFWDRLPLSAVFMAFMASVVADRIGPRAGLALLGPLLLLGAGSVWYWRWSELQGAGDLRPYGVAHFHPVVLALFLAAFFRTRYTRGGDCLLVIGLFLATAALEALDRRVFAAGGLVSGHTLKHLAAAAAALAHLRMLVRRRPLA